MKNSDGSNGIRPHDLFDAGVMFCQLSYEATQLWPAPNWVASYRSSVGSLFSFGYNTYCKHAFISS